jgi:hypothetical protein
MRGLKHFAVGAVAFAIVAWASLVQAGSITINKYTVNPGGGGAEIIANYSGINTAECCPSGNIEFLQMITLTDGAGKAVTVPGAFNGQSQFIDPQPNQALGASTTDNLPWYDFTYKNYPKAGATPNNGAGPYIYDRPSGWAGIAQNTGAAGKYTLNFMATTLVVCVTGANTAAILGGFNWGFTTVNPPAPGVASTTLTPITAIDPENFNTATFQTALNYFATKTSPKVAAWSLVAPADDCCALTVYVPTPSALYGIPVCLIGLAACRRVYKAAA